MTMIIIITIIIIIITTIIITIIMILIIIINIISIALFPAAQQHFTNNGLKNLHQVISKGSELNYLHCIIIYLIFNNSIKTIQKIIKILSKPSSA